MFLESQPMQTEEEKLLSSVYLFELLVIKLGNDYDSIKLFDPNKEEEKNLKTSDMKTRNNISFVITSQSRQLKLSILLLTEWASFRKRFSSISTCSAVGLPTTMNVKKMSMFVYFPLSFFSRNPKARSQIWKNILSFDEQKQKTGN